jgi:hypothetical protein
MGVTGSESYPILRGDLFCLVFAMVKNKKPTRDGELSIPFSAGGLRGGLAAFSLPDPVFTRIAGGHAGIRTLDPGFARMHP